ncbi:MAG: hypothetical protein KDB79_04005 [Acidobacteria bacterium]|nr:hypothetical protein [Acidobacteriota bacterium]
MRKVLIIGIAAAALISYFSVQAKSVAAETVLAKCAMLKFDAEYKNSKAVFVGKVIAIEKDGDSRIFEFEVQKFWKGIDSKTVKVSVYENMRFQAQFKVDREYLVFAKGSDSGILWDGRCSRSRDLAGFGGEVDEDLKSLGDAKKPVNKKG